MQFLRWDRLASWRKTLLLTGVFVAGIYGLSAENEGMVSPASSGEKAADSPSIPKVESKTRSRKIASKIPKALVEGDLDVVENGLEHKKETPKTEQEKESGQEDGQAGATEQPEDSEEENIYVPVDPNAPLEKNPTDTSGNAPDPESLKNPLLLPEITRKRLKNSYRSVSTSRQFSAMGDDTRLCSSLTSMAERIKTDFLAVLTENDAWKYNITIHLIGKAGDPVVTNPFSSGIEIIGGQPFFALKIQIGQGLDMSAFQTYLTEMLIYERSMRRLNLSSLPEDTKIPSWLVTGISEAMLWKRDTADRGMYAALFERGEILTLAQLFKAKDPIMELDASSYGVYKASCGALISCLLNQTGGPAAFKRLMDQSVFMSIDGETLLKQNFPALNISKNSLYKWWALQLSTMAVQPMTESLTMIETDQKLEEYSHVPYYDEEIKTVVMVGPEDYKRLMKLPVRSRKALLQPVLVNLVQLSYRSFPYQRDLVIETIRLVEAIMQDKLPKDIDKRLQTLKANKKLMLKIGERSRDYLDWYTIVNATHTSGSFNSYLKTMDILRDNKKEESTPMSKYLDDLEKLISPSYSDILED